ncbi:MAG: phospho-N-acetylmuramoyl-pentapeptide-transferase [Planctomycetota bacterium]
MLYWLFYPSKAGWVAFHLFRYITFRAALASVIAFLICTILGPWFIARLRRKQFLDNVSEPDSDKLGDLRKTKKGTPTMGGLLIIGAVLFSTLMCADLKNIYILLGMFVTACLCCLGWLDDYIKLRNVESSDGMKPRSKLYFQILLGLMVGYVLYRYLEGIPNGRAIMFPFFKNLRFGFGGYILLFVPWVALVLAGTSNAVNLTDGLDGLAAGCTAIAAMAFGALSYVVGNVKFSSYLFIQYVPDCGELSIFCAAVTGAVLGFLWYNCHPAEVFMGDTGSLPLGGAIGFVAIACRQEFMLPLVGGIFVIELFSVILQVLWFKHSGKRIFLCAPLHHHFEFKGWSETKVVVRFWIVAAVLAVISLATLKVR